MPAMPMSFRTLHFPSAIQHVEIVDGPDALNDLLLIARRGKSKETLEDGWVSCSTGQDIEWSPNGDGTYTVKWVEVTQMWRESDPLEMTLADLFAGRWSKEARRRNRKEARS